MLTVAALPVPGLILTLALPRATGPPADTRWRGQSPDEPKRPHGRRGFDAFHEVVS